MSIKPTTNFKSALMIISAFLKKLNIFYYFIVFMAISTELFSQTPPEPPVATSVLVSTVRSDRFVANWIQSVDSSGYYIDVSTDAGFSSILSGYDNRDVGDVSSLLITGLYPNTDYYFRLRAHNANGTSINSNSIAVITGPNIPIAIAATNITRTTFNAHWDLITEATGYYLDVSSDSTFGTFVSGFNNVNVGDVSVYSIDSNLTAKTTYYYRLRSFNSFGISENSNTISLKTLPNTPSIPSNVIAVATIVGTVSLSWANITNDETEFIIERKLSNQTDFTQIGTAAAGSTMYIDNTVAENKIYNYRIKAINDYYQSDWSETASVTSLFSEVPAPSNLVATATQIGTINLSWHDNAFNEAGFVIERKISSMTEFDYLDRVYSDVTTYADNTVNENVTYNYRVLAYNVNTGSSYSNVATVTSLFSPISAPTNLTASAPNEGWVYLFWSDNSNNETGFKVERKLTTETDFKQIGTAGKLSTNYQDNTVLSNTSYDYRVKAFNDNTESLYSNTFTIKTLISDVKEEEIPTSYSLKQNFPNPFNPSTIIKYSVPKQSFVTIKIYDVLGEEVETIVSENKSVGNYSIEFNASKLTSGIYFCQLKTEEFIQTKKMLLLK